MSFQNYVFTFRICAAPRLGWPHGEVECKNMGEVVQRMDCVDGERERERERKRAIEGAVSMTFLSRFYKYTL